MSMYIGISYITVTFMRLFIIIVNRFVSVYQTFRRCYLFLVGGVYVQCMPVVAPSLLLPQAPPPHPHSS